MKLTLHQLKVFSAVAKHQSVTKAAHELHMTQPAVSNVIRQLEEVLDCSLVEVIRRQLSLTPFGEVVLRRAHDLHNVLEDMREEVSLMKGGVSGTLTLATVSTARYFIPELLGRFKAGNDQLHVKLTVCNRHEVISRLKENLDDFVIMSHPPTSVAVDCADFYNDELVVAASNQYPKERKAVSLKSLQQEPWIIRESGSGTRYAMEEVFKKHHFAPNVEMEVGDNEAIKQAVIANMGLSVLSRKSIEMELSGGYLQCLPVTGFPVKHPWFLVKNKGKNLSPIALRFLDSLHSLEMT